MVASWLCALTQHIVVATHGLPGQRPFRAMRQLDLGQGVGGAHTQNLCDHLETLAYDVGLCWELPSHAVQAVGA